MLTGGVDNGGMGGGAVQSDSQPVNSLTIRNSVISGNASPVAGSGFGGAIAGNGVTVENSTISGNVASAVGGGIYANDLSVSRSTVDNNSANFGGGIYAYGDNTTISNSTISGNSATSGGGGGIVLAGFMSVANIGSSTVSGNSATVVGGGIYADPQNDVILTNSIVLGNSAVQGDAEISSDNNSVTLIGGNILGTDVYRDSTDVGDTSAAEVFATVTTTGAGHLADNGGPVRTIALKASALNPALDASDNSALATDARGLDRVDQTLVADSFANGTSADLGAFELQNVAPAVVASGGATAAHEQTASVIDAVLHLTDADSVVLASAKVVITGGFRPGEDVLAFANDPATMDDIAGAYAAATGVLTLTSPSGGATADQFQAALRAVTYTNTSDAPDQTNRVIAFSASDGLSASTPSDKTVSVAPVDDAPTAVAALPTITSLAEMLAGSPPPALAKLADIVVTDSDGGSKILGLAGADAAYFRISGNELFLRDGTKLDFETKSSYSVFVTVDDGTGTTPDATSSSPYTLFVSNISPETILGTGVADTLAGGSDTDRMFGLAGNDKLFGNGGNDTLVGAAGNDVLAGGDGVDTLVGAAGKDILAGGAGVDTLAGGFGRDVMTGGGQRDIFDFKLAAETGKTFLTRDVIKDFTHLQGDDIDLSTIDAKTGAGNQKFTFIGQGAFTGAKGQLHFTFAGPAKTIVEGDTDGNGLADFQIELTGHKLLVQGDFIL